MHSGPYGHGYRISKESRKENLIYIVYMYSFCLLLWNVVHKFKLLLDSYIFMSQSKITELIYISMCTWRRFITFSTLIRIKILKYTQCKIPGEINAI